MNSDGTKLNLANDVFDTILHQQTPSEETLSYLDKCKLSGLAKERLPQSFKRQWLLNQSYLDEIFSFSPPAPGTLLKGAHLLSQNYYDHPGKRFMGDVDILIAKEDWNTWRDFLLKNGYEDITKDTWEANNFKAIFLKKSGPLELAIELHTRLFFQEDHEFSWQKEKKGDYFYLTTEDLFIHLCGHIAYQHTFISLHWLYDIYLLLQKENLNWSLTDERAKKAGVFQSCQIILWCMREHFLLKDLPRPKLSFLTKKILQKFLTKEFLINPTDAPIVYQLIKHITKDKISQALTYDLLWVKNKL